VSGHQVAFFVFSFFSFLIYRIRISCLHENWKRSCLEASPGRCRIEVANYGCKGIKRENLAIDDGFDEDDDDEIVNGVSGRAGHDVKYCTGYHVASARH